MIEFVVRPPALCSNTGILREPFVHRSLKRRNRLCRVDLAEQLANERFMRFDEAEKPVGILLVTAAADPKAKSLVHYREHPPPIFSDWLPGLNALAPQAIPEELCQSFSPHLGIDLLLFAVVWRKSVRPKLNMCLHAGAPVPGVVIGHCTAAPLLALC